MRQHTGPLAVRRPTISWLLGLGLLVAAVIGGGCRESGPQRVSVSGTVTLDGHPLEEGAILFTPIDGTPGPKAAAAIVDGQFHLDTESGPPVGRLRVAITNQRPPQYLGPYDKTVTNTPTEQPTIPVRYNDASTLTIETKAESENHFEFDLRSTP